MLGCPIAPPVRLQQVPAMQWLRKAAPSLQNLVATASAFLEEDGPEKEVLCIH